MQDVLNVLMNKREGKGGAAVNVLFNKMKQGMVGSVNDEIYVCARHK